MARGHWDGSDAVPRPFFCLRTRGSGAAVPVPAPARDLRPCAPCSRRQVIMPSPAPLILYVDDDTFVRRSLTMHLRAAGFRTLEAATGGEALRRAADDHPDLAILDVRLPDVDGLEVCRRLKADPA